MNITDLIKELKVNIRNNKKDLKENIKSMMTFFNSGNPNHIVQYQDVIHNYADEIFALDDIIQYQLIQLDKLKQDYRLHTDYHRSYYHKVRKHRLFERVLHRIASEKKLFFYEKNKNDILKLLHQKYDHITIEEAPVKPVSIECAGKYILEF